MSTMYYTYPDKQKVGQTHSLGRDKGYHFTWCMYPDEFAQHLLSYAIVDMKMFFRVQCFVKENGTLLSFQEFKQVVSGASSHSFEKGIE